MSGIDELKNNAEDQTTRIDITGATGGGRHRVILPANSKKIEEDERVEIDLTAEIKNDDEEKDSDIHDSLAKDLLEGEDSVFGKWKKQKEEEMIERLATFDQERELAEEEAELEEDELESNEPTFGTDSVMKSESVKPAENKTVKESNIIIMNKEDIKEVEIDQEDDEDVEIVTESVKEDEVVVEEEAVEEKKEEIVVDDSDLEYSKVSSDFVSEIEEDDESQNKVDDDEVLEHLQKLATERLKPVAKSMNLSSFTILKKPTANIKALEVEQVKAAKWVLPVQEGVVLMKEFLGSELESLREFSENSNSVSSLYKKYRCVYDHIVSPKPDTYEAWLKSTPYNDLDHYFFAIYMASFKGTNYIPLDCADKKCSQTFITEDMPIMDMVKFADDKAKEKFNKLNAEEDMTVGKGIYCSEIVPLSNKIAVGFKDASIYNLFEVASLDEKFAEKYASIIEFIPYIDALYIIDEENQTLSPIGYKIYPDNAAKSTKSKIKTFFNVLKNLSVDEFTPIKSFVRSITERSSGISYVYPAVSCPYCGTTTNEVPTTAEAAVFLRYQLGALSNMSLK